MKRILMTLPTLLLMAGAQAQILNGGFETWDTVAGAIYPTSWQMLPGSMIWTRVSEAHSGNYAMEVSVWYYYGDTRAEQWAAINYRPAAFTGWYKYTDNIIRNNTTGQVTDDTAFATVYLTKWNAATLRTDTVGRGNMSLTGTSDYKRFSCPISYSGTDMPDTVVVSMDPSMMRNGGNYFSTSSTGYSSFLKIDDLALEGTANAVDEQAATGIQLWPNPVTEELHLLMPTGAGTLVLTDLAGRVVARRGVTNGFNHIPLPGLPAGVYQAMVYDWQMQVVAVCRLVH